MRALAVGLVLFVGLFFALGKIRYAINPLMREARLQQFLTSVKQDGAIDPEKFWEFRDFYAATTSTFNPENIAINKPFLVLKTPYIISSDYLGPPPDLSIDADFKDTIFQDQSSIVFSSDQKLYIRFVKPQSEMLKANGFFRYFGVDLEQYEDYMWYNETVISL